MSNEFKKMMTDSYTSGKELAKEFGISPNTVTALRNGTGSKNKRRAILDYMNKKITSRGMERYIEPDLWYARTPMNIDEYIVKNGRVENIDDDDRNFLHSLFSRGIDLTKVSEQTIRNMLRAYRENIKENRLTEGEGKKE